MEVDFDALIQEGQNYAKMKQEFNKSSNPEVGEPGWLISSAWIKKYYKFIQYDKIKVNMKPQWDEDHYKNCFPGQITNYDIVDNDKARCLEGTGKLKGFESTVFDRQLKDDMKDLQDYIIVSDKMWEALSTKYGFDVEVKRFYKKQNEYSYYTTLEVNLPKVACFLAYSEKMQKGFYTKENLQVQRVLIRKTNNYTDFKKRIADVVAAQQGKEEPIDTKFIRLWLYKIVDSGSSLIQSLNSIAESPNTHEAMQTDGKEMEVGDVEENSGFEFPGETLEHVIGTALTFESKMSEDTIIFCEIGIPNFQYKLKKEERAFVGVCEWCTDTQHLKFACKCKRVRYCNQECANKDERYHLPKCSARADEELNDLNFKKHSNAKNGTVGLSNLGNTCFMNSSLQCLSNTYELTMFFLQGKYKFMTDLKIKNPLGTEGRLVMAYAKTLNEMWNQSDSSVRPDMFKRILGEYAQQFQGYSQHDSHECINTILDLLGEDLYRKGKKPYVEDNDKEVQDEEERALEAWHKHLLRNESIITDLFHGQFRSTVHCKKCDRFSITFDPMMTMMLPIPAKKMKVEFFYVPYHLKDGFVNKKANVLARETDTVATLRDLFQEKYGVQRSSFLISRVQDNEVQHYFGSTQTIDQIKNQSGGLLLFYEIDPQIQANIPDSPSKTDSHYGVDAKYTPLVINLSHLEKMSWSASFKKQKYLPRVMWIEKQDSLMEVHIKIFNYLKHLLSEWVDYKDPGTKRDVKDPKKDLRKLLIDFPYRPKGWSDEKPFTKEDFDSMTLQNQFEMCMGGLIEDPKAENNPESWEVKKQPYRVYFKDISGWNQNCQYCDSRRCDGCPVPYIDNFKVQEIFEKLQMDSNETLFEDDMTKGKEFQVTVVWHQDLTNVDVLFAYLTTAVPFDSVQGREEIKNDKSEAIRLVDCLAEFKQSEVLDEENMWYCKNCKEHVQAVKTLELFRVPRILIITLKRFKIGKSKYSAYGIGGSKLDTMIDFPLENLDMTPFVLSKHQKENSKLIYDCFAVSNHFGGVGGGHYTAYGQNPIDKKWYDFDDSRCSQIDREDVGTTAAYSLFYRLRDHVPDISSINYEQIQQCPDFEFLERMKAQK